jgi:hypothetical protein
MGFWEHVNQELKRAVEEGWTAVKESARIGKLRLNIHNLHKDAERHFKDIGGIVYEMAVDPSENPLHKPEVQRHIGEIKRIETQAEALEAQITKLKHKESGTESAGK